MTSLTSQSGQAAARAEPMALPMLQRSWAKIKQAQLWGNMCLCESDRWRLLDNSLAFKGLNFKRVKNENQPGIIHWNWSFQRVCSGHRQQACQAHADHPRVADTWIGLGLQCFGRNPQGRDRCWEHFGLLCRCFFPQVASRLPSCGWLQRTTTWRHF